MAYHRKSKPDEQEAERRPPVLLEPTEDGDLAGLCAALLDAAIDLLQRRPDLIQSHKKDQAA